MKDIQQLTQIEIDQLTQKEIQMLKAKYDKDFLKYWRNPDGSSKYSVISMDEFKRRFFKTSVSSSNKESKKMQEITWYCDDCGEECPSENVIAGFGFCDKCREASSS